MGGQTALAIAYDDDSLRTFLAEAARVSPGNPILIDQFIEDAFEVDVDAVADGERVVLAGAVQLIINTPLGQQAYEDQAAMRATAIQHNILLISTMSAAQAAVSGIKALRQKEFRVRSLQCHHAGSAADSLHS